MSGPVKVFHFTCPVTSVEHADLVKKLLKKCKKWVFQKEAGEEDGYLHWQGQVALKSKARLASMVGKKNWLPGCHWSVAHDVDDWDYAEKEETRVDGPWSDDTMRPVKLTRPSREFEAKEKYPWQRDIMAMVEVYEERILDVIYDPDGCRGKTTLARYLAETNQAFAIPPLNDGNIVMQYASAYPNKKMYMIDMPKAMDKRRLADLYCGIESLKNGIVYETRYEAKQTFMDPPRVIVFTNSRPNSEYLSYDRWRIWVINDANELVLDETWGLDAAL